MSFATTMPAGTGLAAGFEPFAADLEGDSFVRLAAARCATDEPELRRKVRTLLADARFGLDILDGYELAGRRILEVGAGAGFLSSYLRSRGLDVISCEPAAIGFSEHRELALALTEYLSTPSDRHLPLAIEELDPLRHGTFDFICSIHVLEHVAEVETCLVRLDKLLEPDGMMVHVCPNYIVSYEPHYRIPLVPLFPRLTRFVVPRRIARQDLWRSLNFITLSDVARCARRQNSHVTFRTGTMRDAFSRLGHDSEFRERQRGLVTFVSRCLDLAGANGLLAAIPPLLSTPMCFEWRKTSPRDSAGPDADE